MNHYDVLGIPPSSDAATIRNAYRRRARQTHPDRGGDADEFVAVSQAWTVLSSPDARARYDEELTGSPSWGEQIDLDARLDFAPPVATNVWTPPRHTALDDAAFDDEPDDPGSVSAFTSPPRALPSVEPALAALGSPPARPSGSSMVLGAAAFLLPAVCVLALETMAGQLVADDVRAALMGSAMLAAVVAARLRMTVARRRERRAMGWLLAFGMLFATLGGVAGLVGVTGTDMPAVRQTAAVVICFVALSVVVWRVESRVWRINRWYRRATALVTRSSQAQTWNELLALRADAGGSARIRRLVSRGPLRVSRGWALIDVAGRRLAEAPPGAPEAWAEAVRAGGTRVRDVPRRGAARWRVGPLG